MAALVLLRQRECHVEQVDWKFVCLVVSEREGILAQLLQEVLNCDRNKDRCRFQGVLAGKLPRSRHDRRAKITVAEE